MRSKAFAEAEMDWWVKRIHIYFEAKNKALEMCRLGKPVIVAVGTFHWINVTQWIEIWICS